MHIEKLAAALLLLALPTLGLAAITLDANVDSIGRAPEPETLALFAGAAIAWAIVRWKKRK